MTQTRGGWMEEADESTAPQQLPKGCISSTFRLAIKRRNVMMV